MADEETAGKRLNLTQLREALEARGVRFSAGSLSDLLNSGEGEERIATQLQAQREANKVFVPAVAVDVLVQFWAEMEQAGIKRDRAPQALAAFLRRQAGNLVPGGAEGRTEALVALSDRPVMEAAEPRGASTSGDVQQLAPLLMRLVELAEDQNLRTRAVSRAEAAQIMGVAESSVSKHIPPLHSGYYSERHIQAWLREREDAAVARRAARRGTGRKVGAAPRPVIEPAREGEERF